MPHLTKTGLTSTECCKVHHYNVHTVPRTGRKGINSPTRPRYSSGCKLLESHGGRPGSRPRQSMRDLWWARWHWEWFLRESSCFPPVSIIPPLLLITHASCGGWTKGQLKTHFHRDTVCHGHATGCHWLQPLLSSLTSRTTQLLKRMQTSHIPQKTSNVLTRSATISFSKGILFQDTIQ